MFVYGLVNTVFDFSARYCFEDDKSSKSPLLCFKAERSLTFNVRILNFIEIL